jgi:hypothetical protein
VEAGAASRIKSKASDQIAESSKIKDSAIFIFPPKRYKAVYANIDTVGEYPPLPASKTARATRDEARKLIVVGIRPESPKQANSNTQEQPQNTFANVTQEWLDQRGKEQRSEKTLSGVESRSRRLVLPFIGNLETDQIQACK